jgi:prepilin-type N-terminal cleavage/methylation domain-containing protein
MSRPGFSMFELLLVLAIAAIVSAMVMPSIGRSMAQMRVQRAVNVMSADLQMAHSTAARQRTPVRVSIDTANKIVRVRDAANPARVFMERRYDGTSEYPLTRLAVSDTSVTLYPSGLAGKPSGSWPFSATFAAAGKVRILRMTRTGQLRIN